MIQISKAKTSRINNRINLVFSDNSYLPLFIDDYLKLSLTKGQDIDQETYNLIVQKSLTYLAREYTLRQIAISPKSKKNLSQKLNIFLIRTVKKFNLKDFNFKSIIEDIIDQLESRGLLNQDDFINYFVKKNSHKSSRQILNLLSQQNIKLDPNQLKDKLINDDSDLIKKYLNKKKINPKDLSDFKYRQKITARLYQQGFDLNDIRSIIDAYSNLK